VFFVVKKSVDISEIRVFFAAANLKISFFVRLARRGAYQVGNGFEQES
jgi:hypothetical protein